MSNPDANDRPEAAGASPADAAGDPSGRLLDNITHFARLLRAAGMPVGPARVLDAVAAVEAASRSETVVAATAAT